MTTNVSAENEQFIRQAIADGRFANWDEVINEAVLRMREESAIAPTERNGVKQWADDLRAWAASHRGVAQSVEYDRGSIYAGRGE